MYECMYVCMHVCAYLYVSVCLPACACAYLAVCLCLCLSDSIVYHILIWLRGFGAQAGSRAQAEELLVVWISTGNVNMYALTPYKSISHNSSELLPRLVIERDFDVGRSTFS